jgi:hypothetical protein
MPERVRRLSLSRRTGESQEFEDEDDDENEPRHIRPTELSPQDSSKGVRARRLPRRG